MLVLTKQRLNGRQRAAEMAEHHRIDWFEMREQAKLVSRFGLPTSEQTDELIRQYLVNGGAIQKCPTRYSEAIQREAAHGRVARSMIGAKR